MVSEALSEGYACRMERPEIRYKVPLSLRSVEIILVLLGGAMIGATATLVVLVTRL